MNEIVIRPATPDDIPAIVALIDAFAAQNLMLPRTEESVRQSLSHWLVAVEDGRRNPQSLLGCGSLAALTEELAEIRSLAVHREGQGKGIGSRLVDELVTRARARGYRQVCALTLREHFFERLGFTVVDRWSISPKLWQECIYCPKFHRCDEVAVMRNLDTRTPEPTGADTARPVAWNPLLKWPAWQPLKRAYSRKPIQEK